MSVAVNRGARRLRVSGRVHDTMPVVAGNFVMLAFAYLGKRDPVVGDRRLMERLREAMKRRPHQGAREIERRRARIERYRVVA